MAKEILLSMFLLVVLLFSKQVICAPRIYPENMLPPQLLTLPSNATSIRTDISDSFNCEGRDYGYYADVENDCQLFHVCLPIKYQDGRSQMFRWSFICPEETIFNQEIFTCTRSDESIDCAESPNFYNLNHRNFGNIEMDVSASTEQPSANTVDNLNVEKNNIAEISENVLSSRTLPRRERL